MGTEDGGVAPLVVDGIRKQFPAETMFSYMQDNWHAMQYTVIVQIVIGIIISIPIAVDGRRNYADSVPTILMWIAVAIALYSGGFWS